ncbi:MAG: hypothetical protein UHO11_07585 [Treponema sp.]|nr:hypothetical protein [Treponema sp.]
MTDKEEIKFAIRYLKQGLKSKRTPPLYEELMNELGFVKKDKVNNLISVTEVRLANWQKYSKELKEAKDVIKKLYSHVFQGMGFMEINDYNVEKAEAEQFLKECE